MSDSSSGRTRRKFTPEFKAEAVQVVRDSGGKIAQVARELNIYDSTLGNWVRRSDEEAAGAPTAAERAGDPHRRGRASRDRPSVIGVIGASDGGRTTGEGSSNE